MKKLIISTMLSFAAIAAMAQARNYTMAECGNDALLYIEKNYEDQPTRYDNISMAEFMYESQLTFDTFYPDIYRTAEGGSDPRDGKMIGGFFEFETPYGEDYSYSINFDFKPPYNHEGMEFVMLMASYPDRAYDILREYTIDEMWILKRHNDTPIKDYRRPEYTPPPPPPPPAPPVNLYSVDNTGHITGAFSYEPSMPLYYPPYCNYTPPMPIAFENPASTWNVRAGGSFRISYWTGNYTYDDADPSIILVMRPEKAYHDAIWQPSVTLRPNNMGFSLINFSHPYLKTLYNYSGSSKMWLEFEISPKAKLLVFLENNLEDCDYFRVYNNDLYTSDIHMVILTTRSARKIYSVQDATISNIDYNPSTGRFYMSIVESPDEDPVYRTIYAENGLLYLRK